MPAAIWPIVIEKNVVEDADQQASGSEEDKQAHTGDAAKRAVKAIHALKPPKQMTREAVGGLLLQLICSCSASWKMQYLERFIVRRQR